MQNYIIPGYNNRYILTPEGVVYSNSNRTKRDGVVKISISEDGYSYVRLCADGKVKKHFIHRLIAQAYIPNEFNLEQVNHIDGNKSNNTIGNLEWCSRLDNMRHASKHGLMQKGQNRPSSKITEKDAVEIRNSNLCGRELAQIYGISKNTVLLIKRGIKWAYLNSDND